MKLRFTSIFVMLIVGEFEVYGASLNIVPRNSPVPTTPGYYQLTANDISRVNLEVTGTNPSNNCATVMSTKNPSSGVRNEDSYSYVIINDRVCTGLGQRSRTRNAMKIAYAAKAQNGVTSKMVEMKDDLKKWLKENNSIGARHNF